MDKLKNIIKKNFVVLINIIIQKLKKINKKNFVVLINVFIEKVISNIDVYTFGVIMFIIVLFGLDISDIASEFISNRLYFDFWGKLLVGIIIFFSTVGFVDKNKEKVLKQQQDLYNKVFNYRLYAMLFYILNSREYEKEEFNRLEEGVLSSVANLHIGKKEEVFQILVLCNEVFNKKSISHSQSEQLKNYLKDIKQKISNANYDEKDLDELIKNGFVDKKTAIKAKQNVNAQLKVKDAQTISRQFERAVTNLLKKIYNDIKQEHLLNPTESRFRADAFVTNELDNDLVFEYKIGPNFRINNEYLKAEENGKKIIYIVDNLDRGRLRIGEESLANKNILLINIKDLKRMIQDDEMNAKTVIENETGIFTLGA